MGGQINGVFTPAGVDSCGPLDKVAAKEWERVLHVNLLGTAAVVRSALPYLKTTQGRIVTCGDQHNDPKIIQFSDGGSQCWIIVQGAVSSKAHVHSANAR